MSHRSMTFDKATKKPRVFSGFVVGEFAPDRIKDYRNDKFSYNSAITAGLLPCI